MTDKIAEVCDETMTFDLLCPPRVHGCERPAGHSGWHRDKSGASWIERMPAAAHLSADLVAEYDRGVAAGRRQAADELMRQVGNTTGDQTPDQIRWFALEVLNDIAGGAPAEPVEEADRG